MSGFHIFLLTLFAVALSCGQVLFKIVATRCSDTTMGMMGRVLSFLTEPLFWTAGFLYGLLTLYWIWLLTFIPLSKAYPFSILSMVFITVLSGIIFKEPLSLRLWLGILFVCLGILIISSGSA